MGKASLVRTGRGVKESLCHALDLIGGSEMAMPLWREAPPEPCESTVKAQEACPEPVEK